MADDSNYDQARKVSRPVTGVRLRDFGRLQPYLGTRCCGSVTKWWSGSGPGCEKQISELSMRVMLRLLHLMRRQNHGAPRKCVDHRALFETSYCPLPVKEHREKTLIYDAEVAKANAMTHQRNLRVSGDPRALLKTHVGPSFCPRALRGPVDLRC